MFDITIHIHYAAVDLDIVKQLKPAVVISEVTERFMVRLPSPSDGAPLRAVWFEKACRGDLPTHGLVKKALQDAPNFVGTIADYFSEMFCAFVDQSASHLRTLQPAIYALAGVDAAFKQRTEYWLATKEKKETAVT
jgi:hypothetical protein